MAEIRSIYTKKRTERRTDADRRQSACVEGATVRKLREPERRQSRGKQLSVQTSRRTKPEQRMGIGYVLFLAAALGVAMWVCVGYLQLQADNTARAKNIAALETQLSTLKDENDD